jgi:hypothetical protein
MIRALSLVALLAVPIAAYETATSSCDLLYREIECMLSEPCPSTCATDSYGTCNLPTADLTKWEADLNSASNAAGSSISTCQAITTASSCTGDCAMGADEDGTAMCFPTFAKVSALMTDDGAPAAVINGHYQEIIEDKWFRCYALATESTCEANDACEWTGSECESSPAMDIVRRQNACPDSDYATLVTTVSRGSSSLAEFYATAEDADPSIQPADGVFSGASGVAHSALALAASAAALVALA